MNACTFQRIADVDNLMRKTPGNKRCIVLLHGFGANFADLTGLADIIDPSESWDWYFPNAPLEVPIAPGYAGRAWFPIDMQKLEQALMRGELRPFRNEIPLGFDQASLLLEGLVKELRATYDQVVVGGFSQGSMVSLDFALRTAQPLLGVLLLSSNIVAAARWEQALKTRKAENQKPFKIFQSHGRFDNVLPVDGATELSRFLSDYQMPVEFVPFNGGHEIPYPVLEKAKIFLAGL